MFALIVFLVLAYLTYRLGVRWGRRIGVVPDSTIGALLVAALSAIVFYLAHYLSAAGMW
jgi:hypothetical protein